MDCRFAQAPGGFPTSVASVVGSRSFTTEDTGGHENDSRDVLLFLLFHIGDQLLHFRDVSLWIRGHFFEAAVNSGSAFILAMSCGAAGQDDRLLHLRGNLFSMRAATCLCDLTSPRAGP